MKGNIALLIGSLTGGGAERVTCNLANYLVSNNYNVTLITMSDVKDNYILDKNVKRVYLLKSNERKSIFINYKIRYMNLKKFLLESDNLNCIIAMLPITIFMISLLKKHTHAKLIISERNNPRSYKLYERIIMKYSEKKADGLVAQTREIAKWYRYIKSIEIIPNAINRDFKINYSKERNNKIVSVGRLEKQKNYPMLIKAFNAFSKNHSEYILEIYGQGTLINKLQKLVKELNLSNKVSFKGYVNNISEKISDAKMFIMTSNFEGMPNALIEAMCLGIPCISTDCDGGGAKELIDNNKNGILIKKNDINALVKSMEMLIKSKKEYEKISENAKDLKNKLDYNQIYNKWLKYIDEIANINNTK